MRKEKHICRSADSGRDASCRYTSITEFAILGVFIKKKKKKQNKATTKNNSTCIQVSGNEYLVYFLISVLCLTFAKLSLKFGGITI